MRDNQAMKKLVASVIIIGIFILYSLMYRHSTVAALPSGSSSSSSSDSSSSAPSTSTTTSSGAVYKDGSYTGSAADAQWGVIQVKAIIQNGKITGVQFLQYPNERERSVEINNYADPQLTSEALQAQSAEVDVVTGATDSSDAFMQSLADALSQAQS